MKQLLSLILVMGTFMSCSTQYKGEVGAYYFDGWTGTYANHITPALTNQFSEREPKWGWLTSTQEILNDQIREAYQAGLDFFSFCWYYHGKASYKTDPLNRAYRYYLSSPEKKKLKHTILVTNHAGSEIGPGQWEELIPIWLEMFKDPQYLRVDDKPLLTFYEVKSLLTHFGSSEKLKAALQELRDAAIKAGFKGANIAICVYPSEENIQEVEKCGFDLLTGYNYHGSGMRDRKGQQIPIEKLREGELRLWNDVSKFATRKYIPVSTLGWDPRPWAAPGNKLATDPYYVGFSATSVNQSISNLIAWVNRNKKVVTKQRVILLYAWNENGEGAWLTPGKTGINPLDGVKRALRK